MREILFCPKICFAKFKAYAEKHTKEQEDIAHESRGPERVHWRCPAATENWRPDLSSRAPKINKPVTVRK
jgi:hypothetical protein